MFEPYHEPEGFASTMSAIGSTFFGLYLGLVLYEFESHWWRLGQWVVSSLLVISGGLAANYAGIPINKKVIIALFCNLREFV